MTKQILVVDDGFDDLASMKEVLEREGHELTTATNGEQALDILNGSNDFDLVLLNIKMPTLSGYDVLQLIRQKENYKKIKVSYISIVPEKEANLQGADGFIQKPFTPESLVVGVKKLLPNEGG